MSNLHFIVKKANPEIIFWYDVQTDLNIFSKYSKILKKLNIPPRKWHNSKEWIFEQVKISVIFKKNKLIHFSFHGSKKFPHPYFACKHIYHNKKDELDRSQCYEVKKKDVKIINEFFEIAPSIKGIMLYRIWFHEFPSDICAQSNIEGFNFHSCRIDKFPDIFKNLSNLKRINMEFSWIKMPNSFENCKNLKKINFREDCLIDKFPDDIGNCLNLQELIYREPYSFRDYHNFPTHVRDKMGITTLPASIGKIPNLTKIYLRDCVNLRSLPAELAFFPLKNIQLYNSGHLIKNESNLPKSLIDFVSIEWYYGDFEFNNWRTRKKKFDFDLIIDRLSLVYELLETNVLTALISNFREKKIQIIHILGQWAEKTSDQKTKKVFHHFISEIVPKIDLSGGSILFL